MGATIAGGYNSRTPKQQVPEPSISTPPSTSAPTENFPAPSSTSTISTGSPLFVVSRSLVSSIVPALIYLVFIFFVNIASSFNIFSIILIAVFVLAAVVPILFTPRKYEFYDNSLRIHKIIGGNSEIPYSDITLYDSPARRGRPQIVLSVEGQRRPIVIPGNPSNEQLGQDLNQFLGKKLKKYNPQPGNPPNQEQQSGGSSPTDDTTTAMNADDELDKAS